MCQHLSPHLSLTCCARFTLRSFWSCCSSLHYVMLVRDSSHFPPLNHQWSILISWLITVWNFIHFECELADAAARSAESSCEGIFNRILFGASPTLTEPDFELLARPRSVSLIVTREMEINLILFSDDPSQKLVFEMFTGSAGNVWCCSRFASVERAFWPQHKWDTGCSVCWTCCWLNICIYVKSWTVNWSSPLQHDIPAVFTSMSNMWTGTSWQTHTGFLSLYMWI